MARPAAADADYHLAVAKEAAVIGAALVPILALTRRLTRLAPLHALIAGAATHAACEYSGANAWYIKHGAAAQRAAREAGQPAAAEQEQR